MQPFHGRTKQYNMYSNSRVKTIAMNIQALDASILNEEFENRSTSIYFESCHSQYIILICGNERRCVWCQDKTTCVFSCYRNWSNLQDQLLCLMQQVLEQTILGELLYSCIFGYFSLLCNNLRISTCHTVMILNDLPVIGK